MAPASWAAYQSLYPQSGQAQQGEYQDEDYDEYSDEEAAGDLKEIDHPLEPLPEDMYGVAIGSLIKDSFDTKSHGAIKAVRIATTVALYLLMFGLQVFLVVETKKLVTPEQVKNARVNYAKYEAHMYTDTAGIQHTYNTANGYPRGVSQTYFNAANFATLDANIKSQICMVPLSNVPFLFAIIFIWSLTVMDHIRRSAVLIQRVLSLGTTDLHDEGALVPDEDGNGIEVKALPCWLKLVITTFVLIPRILLSMFMLWMGARWLTATLGFGDLLLNALALAFIFDLAELVYTAVIPYHTKLLAQRTLMGDYPGHNKSRETCRSMFGLMSIVVLAASVSLLYIYKLQQVLPDYKWDVAALCKSYLETELAV